MASPQCGFLSASSTLAAAARRRRHGPISPGLMACSLSSRLAAVLPSGLLHRECVAFALDVGVGDFADHDAVIAELVKSDHLAFDRRGRLADDRRAVAAELERVVAELAVLGLDVTEERAGDRFLSGAE